MQVPMIAADFTETVSWTQCRFEVARIAFAGKRDVRRVR